MIPNFKQMQIRLGKSLATIHLSTPANPLRWIVVPAYGAGLDEAIRQAGQSFYNAQLGVLALQLDDLRGPAAAQRLQAAMHWLRKQPEAQGLPVSYFGVDVGTAVALQAVSGANDVAAVLSWNGRPELAWKYLQAVETPVLLMVDEQQNWLRYWANQAVNAYLGPTCRLEKVAGADEMANLALEWMSQKRRRILAAQSPLLSHKLATGVAALALCASLATTTLASAMPQTTTPVTSASSPLASLDPFSDGVALGAGSIAGDESVNVSYAKKSPKNKPSSGETKLKATDVAGDGVKPNATGSISLVDSSHFKWFADTNITFSTSSSASGAVSEGSFTAPVNASTISGGATASTLNDAFDGYNTLMINGTLPVATGGSDIIYNKNGPASLECSDRQIVFPVQVVDFLSVQRKFYVPTDDNFARWADIYTNTGTDPITITTGVGSNLGSDSNTIILNTSSGDTTADLSDRWVTSMQNFTGTTSSDPRLAHVIQGESPRVGVSVINFVNGDDNPYWGYELTIQPGSMAVILNFAAALPNKASAAAKAEYLAGFPAPAKTCLTSQELAAVVNFNAETKLYFPWISK